MDEQVKKYLSEIGTKGGSIGGKSTSEKKVNAVRKSLELARMKRWEKKSEKNK